MSSTGNVAASMAAAMEAERLFRQFANDTMAQMEQQKANLDKLAASTDAAIQRQAHAISMEVAKNMEQVNQVALQVGVRTVAGAEGMLGTDQRFAAQM
jgi:hypothetical protein